MPKMLQLCRITGWMVVGEPLPYPAVATLEAMPSLETRRSLPKVGE